MKYLKRFKEIFEDVKFPAYMSNPVGYYSAPVGYTMQGSELEEEVVDYSGEYENSREFVTSNKLEDEFLKQHDYVKLEDYDDIEDMITDIGNDEEVIQDLLPDDYYMYYNEDEDFFSVTKKKQKKDIDFKTQYSTPLDSNKVMNVFDSIGLYTEFEPRFSVLFNDIVIGGTTYEIVKDERGKGYHFDVAILDEYQGMGISKPLINKIIDDANTLGCEYLEAEVVNYQLALYLDKIGFDIEDLGYKRLATMVL
jgi:ribosomal protein S18 acetylase RimI-like enzyme